MLGPRDSAKNGREPRLLKRRRKEKGGANKQQKSIKGVTEQTIEALIGKEYGRQILDKKMPLAINAKDGSLLSWVRYGTVTVTVTVLLASKSAAPI